MITMRILMAACVLAIGSSACALRGAQPASEWTLRIDPVPSPAGLASAQPQLTASSEGVLLSWLENAGSQTTFKFSERTMTGWSDARSIAARNDFFANWADVPSVVRLADRTLVAHWLQQSGRQASLYDLLLARSSDDGRTWSPPFSPHHDGTKSEHGFASLFDVRGTGLGQGHAFVAFSRDAGRIWGAPIRVDDAESLGRVDVEQMPDGSAVVGWMELAGRRALFEVRRVDRSGARSSAVTVTDLGEHRNSGYPRMARRGDELVFAWTGSGDSLQIQTAVARVP